MTPDEGNGQTPDRPMFNPKSIPPPGPYPKRSSIADLKSNPRVAEFLTKALDEMLGDHLISHEVVSERRGQTLHRHIADCILVRLSHEFPGIRGLLLGDDDRVRPDVKLVGLGIGPDIAPVPDPLQLPVIGLAIAATYLHRTLLDIFENTSRHGIDARAAMLGPEQERLASAEKVLEDWRHHLGLDVFEVLQSLEA